MDLPSRYSLNEASFRTADEQIAADERRDRKDEEGQPRIAYFRINYSMPHFQRLHKALVQDFRPDWECPSCKATGLWEDTHEEVTYRRKRYEDGPEEREYLCPLCGRQVEEIG